MNYKTFLTLLFLIPIHTTVFAQSLGTQEMAAANKAAGELVRAKMQDETPDDAKLLDKVKSAEIVVVQGDYDRVQDVLNAVEIKHRVITRAQFEAVELTHGQLLIMNCGSLAPSKKAIKKIRKFVKAGGFLYTTDWALKHVVQRAFPKYIKWNGRSTGNDVVPIKIKRKDNVFLQHVSLAKGKPQWWFQGTKGGNIRSAYTTQRMTTNIVVERKKDQKRIQKLYNRRLNSKAEKAKGKSYRKGKSVRILKTKGKKLLIRTDSGDESWIDKSMLY